MTDWPVDMDEAAAMLRISRRTLTSLLDRHPHYVQGGKKKVFYQRDIASPPHSTSGSISGRHGKVMGLSRRHTKGPRFGAQERVAQSPTPTNSPPSS